MHIKTLLDEMIREGGDLLLRYRQRKINPRIILVIINDGQETVGPNA